MDERFLESMRALLGEEYPAYYEAVTRGRPARGLRVNTDKVTAEEFLSRFPAPLAPLPVCTEGFLAADPFPYGAHPYHHAGLYYMQEPSAMTAVALLKQYLPARPLAALDLCAAPGGKSTQLASALPPGSVLYSNEVDPARSAVLSSNLERWGAGNAVVTCCRPQDYARLAPGVFDVVAVDAPCSGEGMFRKEPQAVQDWSPRTVEACSRRQSEILESAARCVAPEGLLLYSTCTLNTAENEGVIERFLQAHPLFSALPAGRLKGLLSPGFSPVTDAVRSFPHREIGEGHFACLLRRTDGERGKLAGRTPAPASPQMRQALAPLWSALTSRPLPDEIAEWDGKLYLPPAGAVLPAGLRVRRAGVLVAEAAPGGRLVPQHGLALFLRRGETANAVSYPADAPETARYLAGETVETEAGFTGWGVFAADGFPLGLVKSVDGTLKNHYPKGLRVRSRA